MKPLYAIKIVFIKPQKYYLVTTSGKMSGTEYIRMGIELLEHSDWCPGTHVLFDHRKLDFSEMQTCDVQNVRDFHIANDHKIGPGRSAIVVGNGMTDLWHTVWGQGEKILPSNTVRIFENFELALDWMQKKKEFREVK